MSFTQEEIKNLARLLQSPQEENVKLAFAILEGKEYPDTIKTLFEEYKIVYQLIDESISEISIVELFIFINQSKAWSRIQVSKDRNQEGLLKNITYLKSFYLDKEYHPLWKKISSHLISLKTLELDGTIDYHTNIEFLRLFKDLKGLRFPACGLMKIPMILRELKGLEKLSFRYNNLSEADFSILLELKHLKSLDLAGCHLDHLPIILAQLISLEELDLSENHNPFSDKDFSVLIPLKNLKKLKLKDNLPLALITLKNQGVEIEL